MKEVYLTPQSVAKARETLLGQDMGDWTVPAGTEVDGVVLDRSYINVPEWPQLHQQDLSPRGMFLRRVQKTRQRVGIAILDVAARVEQVLLDTLPGQTPPTEHKVIQFPDRAPQRPAAGRRP